ncbi:MAG: TIGR02186 family protein, partial [Alphaproteobacteria bacterium]
MQMLALILSALIPLTFAKAQQIATDLSSHEIEINAGFDGAELLLFGHEGNTEDILVIVKGPEFSTTVRRKERVGGIWVNKT